MPRELQDDWLDPHLTDKGWTASLLDAIPGPKFMPPRVGKAVGNVRNNGPQLLIPVEA